MQRFLHVTPERYRNGRFDPGRHPKRDPGNPLHLFQQYAVTAQGYTAIAEKLLEEPYDLFLLYYEQVDSFSHLFMKHAAPKLDWITDEDHARFKDVVAEWYAYQDELLGRVLEKIDLGTTAVFVVSPKIKSATFPAEERKYFLSLSKRGLSASGRFSR